MLEAEDLKKLSGSESIDIGSANRYPTLTAFAMHPKVQHPAPCVDVPRLGITAALPEGDTASMPFTRSCIAAKDAA